MDLLVFELSWISQTHQMLGLLSKPFDVFQLDANAYSNNSGSPDTKVIPAGWWVRLTACLSKVVKSLGWGAPAVSAMRF